MHPEGSQWDRYQRSLCGCAEVPLWLDTSRMPPDDEATVALLGRAFSEMDALEAGAIANADEGRAVGHYWLRAPELAPTPEMRAAIEGTLARVRAFARDVHAGAVRPERAARFTDLLVVGIGGSALGPQLAASALGGLSDRLAPHFLDNTDPDGIDRVLGSLGERLDATLVLIVSKSGSTPETRNGMVEVASALRARGLRFGAHAVAITGEGSALDAYAQAEGFLARFPMWDWVGGRTSLMSAVGLLPGALQGLDIDAMLEGARAMDAATRVHDARNNPAARLALAWHAAGAGRGARDMVVLPYKDRLDLLGRYLQQLVMESLGKERDRHGRVVHQGLAVYGNKGSTDQHAYVQQLRDGVANFFVTFVEVLRDREAPSLEVEPGVTSGDYLAGFLLGTRAALHEAGRPSLTITVERADARALGALIALFERAVGLYASLVDVNAYHQPGVEAGKRAAASVLALQRRLLAALAERAAPATAAELADAAGHGDDPETAWKILARLAANPGRGVRRVSGAGPADAQFAREA